MNLKEQQYVCILAECRSITKAAEKLYISQPALSIYINNLEKQLGLKLFDRIGKKFTLTPAGSLYVEKAAQMVILQKEFEDGLGQLRNNHTGTLSIGIQLRRAPYLLPPVLAKLQTEYPGIRFDVKEGVSSQLEDMLNHDVIQLLVYNLQQPRDELESYLIYQDQILLALPEGHPLEKNAKCRTGSQYPRLELADCLNEFFILPTVSQSLRTHLDKIFTEEHIHPYNILEIRNFETAMQLVAERVGIGFNRMQYAVSMKYHKPVRYYEFGNTEHCMTNLYISHRSGMSLPDYAKRAIQLFIEEGEKLQSGQLT